MLFLYSLTDLFSQIIEFDQDYNKLLGKEVPLFSGKTLRGENFSLIENRGKIVLLNFWSLKCSACFREIEEINALKQKYENKNVVFVSLILEDETDVLKEISVEDGFYKVKKKNFKTEKINYEIIPGLANVKKKYIDEAGSPMLFIIDEKGILKQFSYGYEMSMDNPNPKTINERANYKTLDKKIGSLVANTSASKK